MVYYKFQLYDYIAYESNEIPHFMSLETVTVFDSVCQSKDKMLKKYMY